MSKTNTRGKRLAKNTVSSLIFQLTTIICGFILPRLILSYFGSQVNGLVNSITQFLQIVAFLELGVGAVVQSSLYKPLADKYNDMISKVLVSANKFFRCLALIILVYVIILIAVYPLIVAKSFDFMFTAILVASMSISSFAQYYFGVVDRLLLTADQRGYVQYNSQTITLILNTATCAVLIHLGSSIQLVKLTTSLIYLLRPVFLRWYVNRHYAINRKIKYQGEPIKQKWNGVAQHVAAVVLDSTDNIVLTLFATLSDVSIYSIHHLAIYGVKQLFTSMTNGINALLGELWAKQEINELEKTFSWTEWSIHTGTVFVFGCTGMLIMPFVMVYTYGITDANYIQPLFATLITLAHACHCLRLPYNIMILAGGHYKQTKRSYIIAAMINIVISVVTVNIWGLVGVAIGTLVAMLYQTIWMALYVSKNLVKWPIQKFVKQILVDIATVLIGVLLTLNLSMESVGYINWLFLACEIAAIWGITVLAVNVFAYRDKTKILLRKIMLK